MKKYLILVAALCSLASGRAGAAERRPNVLFILVDDMQSTAIHHNGNPQVATPHIDSIYENGIAFTRAYTNGSIGGALSMPSRAMLMTGRGLFQIVHDGQEIPASHVTMPECFRANGYETFATGKWHADPRSFNRSFAEGDNIFFGGMHPYETNGHLAPRLHHYDPSGAYAETPFVGEKFSSEMFADAAVRFLEGRRGDKRPFFAYVAFTSPHDPRMQHPPYAPAYAADTLDLPVNYLPQHPFDNGDMKVRDELLAPMPRTEEAVRKELAGYYGMVSEVDVQIGRLLRTLRETGAAKNTIVVFASDNGLAVGRHGLMGKQNLYDHSIRVPLVIALPDGEKGTSRDAACYLSDLYPTLCDLAGLPAAASVRGRSLEPVISHRQTYVRDRLLLAYNAIQRALVKDGWKYITYNIGGRRTEQLFNLNADPDEMVDLSHDPAYAFKLGAYRRLLAETMRREGDFCRYDDYYWWKDGGMVPWSEGVNLYTEAGE